jgi:hypothetical protein
MILRLLKGRGMVLGLFERKRDAIPPHPAPPQALVITRNDTGLVIDMKFACGRESGLYSFLYKINYLICIVFVAMTKTRYV